MEPLRTIDFVIRFAAAWSAWWLLLAIPLVVALCVVLYRRQSRTIAWGHAWGLTILRIIIMVGVVFLAFRPSLIRRDTTTYLGRMLVVLDDSASMGIADPNLPVDEAMKIARLATTRLNNREAPAMTLREELLATERILIHFDSYGRSADRTQDAFWREAERVQTDVDKRLGNVAQRAADLAKGTDTTNKLQEVATLCRDLQTFLKPLFAGSQPPSGDFSRKMRAALTTLTDVLDAAQAAADHTALAANDPVLTETLGAMRSTSRLELTYSWLQQQRNALMRNAPKTGLWLLPLSQPEAIPLAKTAATPPAISPLETDLAGVLLNQIEGENPFPLTGVLLLSDGRDLSSTAMETVTRAATLRSIPVYCAGVGDLAEPTDIAIRGLLAPPVAVAGTPLSVRASLKTVLPKPEKVDLALLNSANTVLTNQVLEIQEQTAMERRLTLPANLEGLQRLTVRAGSVDKEVIPLENNRLDLTVRIRPEPIRILFMDEKPRWESRFVLNILSRLDYLDVNSIVVLSQPGGQLKRGVGKGFWPEDAGSLALYDLVILGDLPAETLKPTEWQQLADYVAAGGSLALLGTGQRDPLPANLAAKLLPTQPRTATTNATPSDTAALLLTTAGRHHPITRALQTVAQTAESVTTDRLQPQTIPLLQSSDGRLLVSAGFVGKGKTVLVDTDRLWRRLNASALDAHASLVANLAEWAIEAQPPASNRPQPDLYHYTTREAVQVWTEAHGVTNVVTMRNGNQLLEAPALPAYAGARWAAATFAHVPSGEWTAAVRGGVAAPEPIQVVNRSRELHDLSRDEALLKALAANASGAYTSFTDAGRLLNDIQPRSRVEHQERTWRLWDSRWVLSLLIAMLTVEWIWRKLAGLV
jgi:hypothetical protein